MYLLLRVLGFLLGLAVFAIFLLHTFFPELVNVDRNTFYFLGFLLFLLLLPTLKSGKLTYILEFQRKLGSIGAKLLKKKKKGK